MRKIWAAAAAAAAASAASPTLQITVFAGEFVGLEPC